MGKYKLGAKAYKEQWYKKNEIAVKLKAKQRKYVARYGITLEQAEKMKARGCEICGDKTKTLCIDHCHITGRLRGVLCHGCNLLLGRFKENIEILDKAKTYIISRCQI